MILEIKKFNSLILRKKAEKVRKIDSETRKLILDMAETMKKNQGIGLAAPQVGIAKRVIVIQWDYKNSKIKGLINPLIVKKSFEKEIGEEGCLSFPGIFLEIKRAKKIEVAALDIRGNKIKIEAKGLLARVLQHEIDHLEGILFFQRLSFLKKLKFGIKHPLLKL